MGAFIFIVVLLAILAPEILIIGFLFSIIGLMFIGWTLTLCMEFLLNLFKSERNWDLSNKIWREINEIEIKTENKKEK